MINNSVLELTKQLIAEQSITPDDASCQQIIANFLEKIGFKITNLPFGNVKNLWASYGNLSASPLLVFAGHTDVVPVGDLTAWNTNPFSATIIDDYLYGRGAADMKGNLAAMLIAVADFIKANPKFPGSIGFLITSDEEGDAQDGTKKVIQYLAKNNIKIDYCIVGEPTCSNKLGDTIKNGRRGSLLGNLKIIGTQGHVAYPELANNPIHLAPDILNKLTNLKLSPNTTLQFSNINSGTGATNVIPEYLECIFSIRFCAKLTAQGIQNAITEILDASGTQYKIDWVHHGDPFITKSGKLLDCSIQAIEDLTEITPELSVAGGTSDARFIAPTGAEVIELGLCNKTIHSVNECVQVKELVALPGIYERILELVFIST
ncbi:MAG: succinyl-diaminopimelate desuccinylase [Legionellales bacterium]|nr:MAG: succinyl-diaminopimelate desuccinylase [Legionellales bacterium]